MLVYTGSCIHTLDKADLIFVILFQLTHIYQNEDIEQLKEIKAMVAKYCIT